MLAELISNEAERFWSGERVPKDLALESLKQGEWTTLIKQQEPVGYQKHETGRSGGGWLRPMSSSGHLFLK